MTVMKILRVKGEGPVYTVPPTSTIAETAEILSARRIGALVVSRDGKVPLGIVSERDIVREVGKRGAACLGDPVTVVMTEKLVTCTRTDGAVEVLQRMTDGRFRHMPVLDGAEMVAVISIGDVVKMRLGELAMERDALEDMVKGH
jgi:CBS domain-containing protein